MDNKSTHPIFTQEKPWEHNENKIWLASTIQFVRNMEKFVFPTKLQTERAKQIISLISKEFLTNPLLNQPKMYLADQIGPLQKEFLVEHYLTSKSFHQTHSGEAFIVDDTGEFLMTINIEDHFNLQVTDSTGDLESAWNKLVKIETSLGKIVHFSYSPTLGFLTANPQHCGTGMLLSVFLQPTALIHTGKLQDILKKHHEDSIYITGLQGDPSQYIGDIITVHNQYTLGTTEETIMSTMRTFLTKIMVEENTVRNQLRKEENSDLKDQVSRAYGVLIHSYQTDTLESMNAIALLKLGADLGWISGISILALNQLFFDCRRAHLLRKFGEEIPPEKLLHKRAEYFHEQLKDIKLVV